MSQRTELKAQPTDTLTPLASGLLQRKCDCGQHTIGGGQCAACSREAQQGQQVLQSSSAHVAHAAHADVAPPIVGEVLGSAGQPLDATTRAFMEPRLGQEFSRVRVHTDERAAESARAVNAQAYTVGRDVVFGAGQYKPSTQGGAWLLAHELTHVAQQSGSVGSVQALSLEPDNSRAEQQATHAANSIITGRPVPGVTSFNGGMTVQRSVGGAIGGGLLGAGVGAAIGSLLGPIGAIVGGLIGGIAGLIAGETSTVDARAASSDEQKEAEIVFGSSMDWGKVRFAESAIMSIGGYARTPFNTVYLPPGFLSQPLDKRMPLLVHELTHVWQTQHGYSVIEKLFYALHGAGIYKYGEEAGLREATAKGKHFKDFNTEQQGDICMDYYVKKKAGKDVTVYLPFIAEVQGLGSALNRPAKDMGDFPTPADEKTKVA